MKTLILLIALGIGGEVYASETQDWPVFSGDDTTYPVTDYLFQFPDWF